MDREKHFQYVCNLSDYATKLEIFYQTNNTRWDIVLLEYKKKLPQKWKAILNWLLLVTLLSDSSTYKSTAGHYLHFVAWFVARD